MNVLPKLVKNYNDTPHSALHGYAPSQIDEDRQYTLLQYLKYPRKTSRKVQYRFKVGDKVRISHQRKVFKRGYQQKWTEEIF